MPAYNGKSKRIKNAIKTLISGIQYDHGSGSEQAFQQVIDNTLTEFEAYPGVRILPGQYRSDKWAVGQNRRTLPFVVSVYILMENRPESESLAIDRMYDLTDLIFDTLDKGDFSGAINTIDPTIGTFILKADRGDFLTLPTPAGIVLYCDINVELEYSIDLY